MRFAVVACASRTVFCITSQVGMMRKDHDGDTDVNNCDGDGDGDGDGGCQGFCLRFRGSLMARQLGVWNLLGRLHDTEA